MPRLFHHFFLTMILSAVVPLTLHAGPIGYIGLFLDDTHSSDCLDVNGLYEQFEVWVWVLPGDNGMICAEYSVDHKDMVFVTGQAANPEHSVALGDPIYPGGVSICFAGCRQDWTWTHRLTMLTNSLEPDYIVIREHPDAGTYQLASCEDGYPLEPVYILNSIGYAANYWVEEPPQHIISVTAVDSLTLQVIYSPSFYDHYASFRVSCVPDSSDTIQVVDVQWESSCQATVVLAEPLLDGEKYIVQMLDYCVDSFSGFCGHYFHVICAEPQYQFEFLGTVGNRSSSWGTIKKLYSD